MAMRQLQIDLLNLLSLGKEDQQNIIKQLEKIIRKNGTGMIEKWRNSASSKNNPFLHELIERDLSDVIRFVIKKYNELNINIKRESDGYTPFQLASKRQNWEICDLLKKLGADATAASDDKEEKERAMNIVWIDLEMTSIEDPEILECAVIITDKKLNELARNNWVIHFDESVLKGLANWHQTTFADINAGGNGLFADVLKSKLTKDEVEEELLALLKRYCPEGKCPLAGSSIHIDKEVLKVEMPKVHNYLHYRIIDVSSFQGIMKRWAPWMDKKIKDDICNDGQETVNHRAMDDIMWSIKFAKGFRKILQEQQYNLDNQQNEPSVHHQKKTPNHDRQKYNELLPLVVQILPPAKNDRAADNQMQLYADERRLMERLQHNKNFDVKSLSLSNEQKTIYIANPHLREVFMNKQPIVPYNKEFTFRNRCLELSSKPYEGNKSSSEKISTIEHWEQRKLLLTEIEFLTIHAVDNTKRLVIYAGAAPGSHINYLSKLFPHLEFVLIDANDFSVTETDEIKIIRENFTDHLARRFFESNRSILFICNVQKLNPNGNSDKDLMNDMENQMKWHGIIKPRASLLNFRLPRAPGKIQYPKGDLVIEPWASKQSTGCRLIVDQDRERINYDYIEFRNTLEYFHNVKRIMYYTSNMDGFDSEGLDHCYDCRAEIFILQEYLYKTNKVKNETELKKETVAISYDISREIMDKKRKSIIGGVRTLDGIKDD